MAQPRLLIIEDDQATQNALRKIFSRNGWSVTGGSTVREGLDHVLADPSPHWVILDLMLPDGDGVDVLRLIRERSLSVRVAVTTGMCNGARLEEVHGLLPDVFFSKPVNLADLLNALAHENE